jgi:hypothetical protein
MPFGDSSPAWRIGTKRPSPLRQPLFEVAESGELREPRRVVLEAQHAAAVQQLVLRFHHGRQIARGDGAVVANRIAREPLGVCRRQAAQVLDQQLERGRVDFYSPAGLAQILVGAPLDDGAPIVGRRQAKSETRREARELLRDLEAMADQQQRDLGVVRRQCDVFEQPDVNRLLQERVKVEQGKHARLPGCANVPQRLFGLGVMPLGFELQIEPLDAVRDRPAEQRAVGACGTRHGDFAQQLEHTRLVRGFDDD